MGPTPIRHAAIALGALFAALAVLAGCETITPVHTTSLGWSLGLDRLDAPVPSPSAAASAAALVAGDTASGAPAPKAPPASGGGPSGGGSSGGAPPEPQLSGEVRDDAEVPLEGVSVLFADGRQATTDASGRFSVPGGFAAGGVIASKPGYATSVVMDLDQLPTLHLRRADGRTDTFVQRSIVVSGVVQWPATDSQNVPVVHNGGVVYYQDSLGSISPPSFIAANGEFALTVTTNRPGEPTGVVLVLSGDQTGVRTLMGVSRPFKPFANQDPGGVSVFVADQTVPYSANHIPPGLTTLDSRLEVVQPGVPALVLEGAASANGSFDAPLPGKLPGTLRVTVTARDAAGAQTSTVSMVPSYDATAQAYRPVSGNFLAIPAVTLGPAGAVGWGVVPGALGYRVSAWPQGQAVPAWEGFTTAGTSLTIPTDALPGAGAGDVGVEAVDAAGLTSRSIASVRQLRLDPWTAQDVYRASQRRVPL